MVSKGEPDEKKRGMFKYTVANIVAFRDNKPRGKVSTEPETLLIDPVKKTWKDSMKHEGSYQLYAKVI